MKKLVMTAALVCAASIVSAQTVTSANIVGYAKKSVGGGSFKIVAAQFLAGQTNGMTLGEAFPNMGEGDQILFWAGTGYEIYTYYVGYGWYDFTVTTPSDDVLIPQGASVWLKSIAGTTTIVAGEVPSVGSVTNTLSVGFNMISNPYPVEMTLGSIPTTSLSDGDQVLLWAGSGYDIYNYYVGYGWYDFTVTIPSDDVQIPVGDGCWLKSAAGGEIVYTKTY